MNYIIFGSPGAGKGVQANLIAKQLSLVHISSGELLRRKAGRGVLGKKIKAYQDKGKLVPNKITIPLMEKEIIRDLSRGLILDGYPRTLGQAKNLDRFLKRKNSAIKQVIALNLSRRVAFQRLLGRSRMSGRSDDNPETIEKRLTAYQKQASPLLKYYTKQKKLININGQGSITEISKKIIKHLKNPA